MNIADILSLFFAGLQLERFIVLTSLPVSVLLLPQLCALWDERFF